MAGESHNFGCVLGKKSGATYTTIGQLVSVDPPEITAEVAEVTHHGSSAKEYSGTGLVGLSEFSAVVNLISADITALETDIEAGTAGDYEISFPNAMKLQFKAIVTKIKATEADATAPDRLAAELSFQPSGLPVWA